MGNESKQELERIRPVFLKKGTTELFPEQPVRGTDADRHDRQKRAIAQIPTFFSAIGSSTPLTRASLIKRAFRKYKYQNQGLCLFNVIVALEWIPSAEELSLLDIAFTRASTLLFDVADSYMALGQVVIGGPELMGCADIQIFASNRLFPRAFVNGLNDQRKYQPIRVGRGLWRKNDRTIIPWDADLGYRTLVHEWAHYALGLKDQYLVLDQSLVEQRLSDQSLVIPSNSPVKNTIMADLVKASELLSTRTTESPYGMSKVLGAADSEWKGLSQNKAFKFLEIDPDKSAIEEEPPQVPVPAFRIVGGAGDTPQNLLFTLPGADSSKRTIDLKHCWVYVIKGSKIDDSEGLLAQGSFTNEEGGFTLLGATQGDVVALVGSKAGKPGYPLVLWAHIENTDTGVAGMGEWHEATPGTWPLVDVVATSEAVTPPYSVELRGDIAGWTVFTFPLGEQGKKTDIAIPDLTVLDGHVMLVAREGDEWKLAIASYSLGGGPADSGGPGHPNPLPAGSADGNAMIFFLDESKGPLHYADIYSANGVGAYEAFKIVTTTNLHNRIPPPPDWKPRSYTFAVTSNLPFGKLAKLHPTLVLYYDKDTCDEPYDRLAIGRYDTELDSWIEVKLASNKPDDFFIAALLTRESAPALYNGPFGVEHYRLFLINEPRSS